MLCVERREERVVEALQPIARERLVREANARDCGEQVPSITMQVPRQHQPSYNNMQQRDDGEHISRFRQRRWQQWHATLTQISLELLGIAQRTLHIYYQDPLRPQT